MFEAYKRIFDRMDLDFRPVEAETGNIGGAFSHEFMVLAESGEDSIVFCTSCDYAANVEKAEISLPPESHRKPYTEGEKEALQQVETRGMRTVAEVTRFLKVDPSRLIKSLVYRTEKGDFAVLVKGDREANEYKIKKVLDVDTAVLASPDDTDHGGRGRGSERRGPPLSPPRPGPGPQERAVCRPEIRRGRRPLSPVWEDHGREAGDRGGSRFHAGYQVQ
jgi:prolyl-tRNA synthetase